MKSMILGYPPYGKRITSAYVFFFFLVSTHTPVSHYTDVFRSCSSVVVTSRPVNRFCHNGYRRCARSMDKSRRTRVNWLDGFGGKKDLFLGERGDRGNGKSPERIFDERHLSSVYSYRRRLPGGIRNRVTDVKSTSRDFSLRLR